MNARYDAADIEVLSGLDPVKRRPGMYTDTTRPNHLAQEVVDNAVDEALAGYCDTIVCVLQADGGVRVEDNGRGIPVEIHPKEGIPAVQLVLTTLHAGGKFDSQSYAVSGGLHGVGAAVVNALSTRLEVEVHREGFVHRQNYDMAVPGPLVQAHHRRVTGQAGGGRRPGGSRQGVHGRPCGDDQCTGGIQALARALAGETEPRVREAITTSLMRAGSEEAVCALIEQPVEH